MKKLPILLLALTVGAEALSFDAYATDEGSAGEQIATNNFDSMIKVGEVNPELGNVYFSLNYYDSEAREVTEVYVASYNYLGGMSVEEADRQALRLGSEIKSKGTDDVWIHELIKRTSRIPVGLGLSFSPTNLAKENPADILYYAVKVENKTDTEVAEKWIRGKIDYRECVHGGYYREGEAMTCEATLDFLTGEYYFVPKGFGRSDAPILGWNEELLEILNKDLDETERKIAGLEEKWEAGEEIKTAEITKAGFELDIDEDKIQRAGKAEEYRERVQGLRERIEAIKTPKPKPPVTEDKEEEDKKEDDTEKEPGGAGDETEKEPGGTEDETEKEPGGAGDETEEEPVKPGAPTQNDDKPSYGGSKNELGGHSEGQEGYGNDKVGYEGGLENAAQDGQDKGLAGQNTPNDEGSGHLETENATEGELVEKMDINISGIDFEEIARREEELMSRNNAEVEVPALGEVQEGVNWWWAVVLVILSLGGTGVWWVKRAFFNKNKR